MDSTLVNQTATFESGDLNQTNAARFSLVEQLILLPAFLGLSFGTVFGNALVIATLVLVRRLREPCNLLLVSLAVSDLLVGLTVVPFEGLVYLDLNSPLEHALPITNQLMCISKFLDILLGMASILNLTAISLDRYLLITMPFAYPRFRQVPQLSVAIAILWAFSVLVGSANFAWTLQIEQIEFDLCWRSDDISYLLLLFAVFSSPLLLMFALWTRIAIIAGRKAERITSSPVITRKVHTVGRETDVNDKEKARSELRGSQHNSTVGASFGIPGAANNQCDQLDRDKSKLALLDLRVAHVDRESDHINGYNKRSSDHYHNAQSTRPQPVKTNSQSANNRVSKQPGNASGGPERNKKKENRALITVAFIIGCDPEFQFHISLFIKTTFASA